MKYQSYALLFLSVLILFGSVGCGRLVAQSTTQTEFSTASEKLSFSKDIMPIIQGKCLNCHGRNFYDADLNIGCSGMISFEDIPLGSLNYSGPRTGETTGCPDRGLYERLTQLKAWGCYSTAYVIPEDPERSFLLMKLKGVPCDGAPVVPPPSDVTAEEINLISRWISEGALNN
jgi:hypothetical protein